MTRRALIGKRARCGNQNREDVSPPLLEFACRLLQFRQRRVRATVAAHAAMRRRVNKACHRAIIAPILNKALKRRRPRHIRKWSSGGAARQVPR